MPSTSKRNYPELQQISAPASELVLFALGIPDLLREGAVQGNPSVRRGGSQSHTEWLQATLSWLLQMCQCAWQRLHCSGFWGFGTFLFQKPPLHHIFTGDFWYLGLQIAIDRSILSVPWASCKPYKRRRKFSINTGPHSLFPILFTHADFQLLLLDLIAFPSCLSSSLLSTVKHNTWALALVFSLIFYFC